MAPAATDQHVYRVLEAFSFDHGGRTYVMKRGDIVSGDNPAYRGRANLFEEVTADAARDAARMRTQVSAVETTAAGPGQLRRMEIDSSVPLITHPGDEIRDSIPTPHPAPAPTPTPAPAPTPPAPTGEASDNATPADPQGEVAQAVEDTAAADAVAAVETTSATPTATPRTGRGRKA